MTKKKWTGTPIPPEQPVRAQPAKSKYKPIELECECFMHSGIAWKMSNPRYEHMTKELKERVQLNSTVVKIATGDINNPVTDQDRTNAARKACASITAESLFAKVWFTSNLYEGGERFFSEPLWIEYEDEGSQKIKISPNEELTYLPMDVLYLMHEGDLLFWTVEAWDSKHQLRKLVLIARANQLDNRNKSLGQFEDAVEDVGTTDWMYALR